MSYPTTLIGITGPSGTGKSTSLRNLKDARVLDVERKGMPFAPPAGASIVPVSDWATLQVELGKAEKDPAVKVIVLDSITAAVDMLQSDCEAKYKGFDIWKYYNDAIGVLLSRLKRTNKCCIITSLEEIVQIQGLDGSLTTRRRMFIQGKEWANKGIESECLAVWTAFARRNTETKKIEYLFNTQTDGVTLAKTPPFWALPDTIPNDVGAALDLIAKNIAPKA